MQIENDYDKEVYNGDIGTIDDVDANAGELAVSFDGRSVKYGFGELDTIRDVSVAARPLGLQIQILEAATSSEIDVAFTTLQRDHPDALFVGADPYFSARRIQIVQHAAHGSIPATYATRENAEIGGLMSYGASIPDAYHLLGVYTGRILKGAKPSDLPVTQASKFELVINHQTARMLSLTVPPSLLSIADEVIE